MVDGVDPTALLQEKRACFFYGYLVKAVFNACVLATKAGHICTIYIWLQLYSCQLFKYINIELNLAGPQEH